MNFSRLLFFTFLVPSLFFACATLTKNQHSLEYSSEFFQCTEMKGSKEHICSYKWECEAEILSNILK